MLSALSDRRHHAFLLLVVLLGVGLSVLAFKPVQTWAMHRVQDDFRRDARDIILELERRIDANLWVLESTGSLYAASVFVERDEFQTFVGYGMLERPGIRALEWVPRVPASQRADYEEAAREEGYPRFQIVERNDQGDLVPASFRDEYFPVYYLEPYQGNETALGFDLASDFKYKEAINKARDTGQKVATGRTTLGEESENQSGFLVFLPIYRNGAPTEALSDRRENLNGFILGDFRIKDIVNNSLARTNSESVKRTLDIQLYDRTAPVDEQLLFAESSSTDNEEQSQPPLHLADIFDVAGRNWEIVIASSALPVWLIWLPWAVLLKGLLFTGCLSMYLVAGLRRTAIIERLVATRTLALSQANQHLEEEIVERGRVEEALHESEQRIRELAAAAVRAHEEERERAALEVHDRIGQPLIAAFQQLQSLEGRTRASSKQRELALLAVDLLQEAIGESRNIMNDLYPSGLDEFGVAPLIETELGTFEEDTGCLVRFTADCPVRSPRDVEVTIYRIFQEALANIRRHAQTARNVTVSLTCTGPVAILEVQDDGPGFNIQEATEEKRVSGLTSMEWRAEIIGGTFEMTSTPGQGTRLTIRVPIEGGNL